jgi:hypothetical protein
MSSEHNTGDRGNWQHSATSWPSATLPAAYFAALLLSSIVSGAVATSIVNRVPPNIKRRNLNGAGGSVFLPMHYILPGLETVDSRGEVMELSLTQPTSDTSISTSAKEATRVAQDNRNESVWAKTSAAKASTAKTSTAEASTAKASVTKASTASAAGYRGEACQHLDLDLVDLGVKGHFRIRKVQPEVRCSRKRMPLTA